MYHLELAIKICSKQRGDQGIRMKADYKEETEIGKEISLVSHSSLLDNYEIYVRPK